MLLYSVYHLNLMYSSIETGQRAEVIAKCYYPLLDLVRSGIPLGIEVTGLTLEIIRSIEPSWVKEFADLLLDGCCELVGAGYAQIIGPLSPAGVNSKNLEMGNMVYKKLLNTKPRIALVNEQAYSAGMVVHYLDAGYEAILTEWDNPYRYHPEWDRSMRYFPQRALGADGRDIPIIWNHSISFQKFQRQAHGETESTEYLSYIQKQLAVGNGGAFSVYGNDAEIFDFRPGRFHTEPPLTSHNEWIRIKKIYSKLRQIDGVKLILPSFVLGLLNAPLAGNRISLETPEQPIPVKKQEKYNIVRWGLTGRGDLMANTLCYRLSKQLLSDTAVDDEAWQELLYLYSSDFRTHITQGRWEEFIRLLTNKVQDLNYDTIDMNCPEDSSINAQDETIIRYSRFIEIRTKQVTAVLNINKGLSLESLLFKDAGKKPLIGTLPHGYYDNMEFGADFFSGHMIYEGILKNRITDLEPTDPVIYSLTDRVTAVGKIDMANGILVKSVSVYRNEPRIDISWKPINMDLSSGVLRLGHITLNPEAFSRDTLFFASHNGGHDLEYYYPSKGCIIEHGRPVSFIVSASQALGITEGIAVLGDARNSIHVKIDKCSAAALGLVTLRDMLGHWFCRLSLSLQEFDDTSKPDPITAHMRFPEDFTVSITHFRENGSAVKIASQG